MVRINAQQWLDANYPKEIRNNIKQLEIDKTLEGSLELSKFENLRELNLSSYKLTNLYVNDCPLLSGINCSDNQIKEIKITNCPQLVRLHFWGNLVEDFEFDSLNPETLVDLYMSDNNFSPHDLSCLSFFINLKELKIGTYFLDQEIGHNRNRFYGSLEALKNMKNLKILHISNTDIESGLEYLPESLENFDYYSENDNFKVKKIENYIETQLLQELEDVSEAIEYTLLKNLNEVENKTSIIKLEEFKNLIREEIPTVGEFYIFTSQFSPNRAIVVDKKGWSHTIWAFSCEMSKGEKTWNTTKKPLRYSLTLEKSLKKAIKIQLGREYNYFIELNKSKVNNVRNLLLIGRTGSGKSALANVLAKSDKFKEDAGSVSVTRSIQSEEFEHKGVKYQVIDTPGVGDTQLPTKEVLKKIIEGTCLAKNGLHQILFVTSSKITEEEIFAYKLLQKIIFDEGVKQCTTVIRTNFPNFQNDKKLYEDLKRMIKENNEIVEMVRSCRDIIYIDNPPIDVDNPILAQTNKEVRSVSRNVILNCLDSCGEEVYQVNDLNSLSNKIRELIIRRNLLQKGLDDIKKSDSCQELLFLYEQRMKKLNNKALEEVINYIEEQSQKEGSELLQRMINNRAGSVSNIVTLASSILGAIVQGLFVVL